MISKVERFVEIGDSKDQSSEVIQEIKLFERAKSVSKFLILLTDSKKIEVGVQVPSHVFKREYGTRTESIDLHLTDECGLITVGI